MSSLENVVYTKCCIPFHMSCIYSTFTVSHVWTVRQTLEHTLTWLYLHTVY